MPKLNISAPFRISLSGQPRRRKPQGPKLVKCTLRSVLAGEAEHGRKGAPSRAGQCPGPDGRALVSAAWPSSDAVVRLAPIVATKSRENVAHVESEANG
jgi:hypothetical protein